MTNIKNITREDDTKSNWVSITAANIKFLGDDGKIFNKDETTIYGNNLHVAIAKVTFIVLDKDGNRPNVMPNVEDVARSVQLANYDDDTKLGGKSTIGWNFSSTFTPGDYPCLLMDTDADPDTDPVSADIKNLKNEIKNDPYETSMIRFEGYYYIRYQPKIPLENPTTITIGMNVQRVEEDFSPYPGAQKFTMSAKDPSNGDGVTITAIPEIKYTVDDFDWRGEYVSNNNQSDEFVPGSPKSENFWRQVAYTVTLKEDEEYPDIIRYRNRLEYCVLLDHGGYGKDNVTNKYDYQFGSKRNGMYAFKGYLWPYNVYTEAGFHTQERTPIVPPPTEGNSNNNFTLEAYGIKVKNPQVNYNKNSLNLTLFGTFGWATSDEEFYYPLYVQIYDQYGNSGSLAVDPKHIPLEYAFSDDESSITEVEFFSTLDENNQPRNANPKNSGHIRIFIKPAEYSNYYLSVITDEDNIITPVLVKGSANELPPDEDKNLMRFYRNPNDHKEDDQRTLDKLTYYLSSIEQPSDIIVCDGENVTTEPVIIQSANSGWKLIPCWGNNSFVFYNTTSLRYITIKNEDADKKSLYGIQDINEATRLEWKSYTDTSFSGTPDDGSGPNTDKYNKANYSSGRKSWVKIGDIQMSFENVNDSHTGYIYPNGVNQAEVTIRITPQDANGNNLNKDTAPTDEYVLSTLTPIAYNTALPLPLKTENGIWEYSKVSNNFSKHTDSEGLNISAIKIEPTEPDLADDTFYIYAKLYITYKSTKATDIMKLGLNVSIHDDQWGDPLVYQCTGQPENASGTNFTSYVYICSKNELTYTPQDLKITAINRSINQDDSWGEIDSNDPDGKAPIEAMYRLWDYQVALSSRAKIQYWQLNDDRNFDEKGLLTFSQHYEGLYAVDAWLFSTNVCDKNFNVTDLGKNREFTIGNYHAVVNNPNENNGTIYLSIYYEFAAKDYEYRDYSDNIGITIYDEYGNKGEIEIYPQCYSKVYDPSKLKDIQFFRNGHSSTKPTTDTATPTYNIMCKDDAPNDQGPDRSPKVITLVDWSSSRVTWSVKAGIPNGDYSQFQLLKGKNWDYFLIKTVRQTMADGKSQSTSLGHGYSDPRAIFAGLPQSNRFRFFFRPVWDKQGFLMCTKVMDEDHKNMGIRYNGKEDEEDNCEYSDIVNNDFSFVWYMSKV